MKANITITLLRNLPEGRDMDIRNIKLPGFVLRLCETGREYMQCRIAKRTGD